jgi:two-component system, chemotaxis family, protein-glutamate methylesterase/glutaminase
MVVDDSAIVRGLITKILESDPEIVVTVSVANGQLAVTNLGRYDIDVIVLDIEMPVMDGLTALPKLLEVDPNVKIIMASTLTERNAEISIRALSAGATDYVPKPSASRDISGGADFRRELLSKVKALGKAGGTKVKARPKTPDRKIAPPRPLPVAKPEPIKLRKLGLQKPGVLAVGSSTGGPQALFAFLKDLPTNIGVPVVITQHMPPTFTNILANHISSMTSWTCEEAKNGDVLEPGKILLAPGDYHMTIDSEGTKKFIRLNQNAPENYCRPAVDPMLRSLVKVFGGRILTVILTGMGSDGCLGSQAVVEAGGTIIAQDEASSVVWGMPGAVAAAGVCSAILPIDKLAAQVAKVAAGVL